MRAGLPTIPTVFTAAACALASTGCDTEYEPAAASLTRELAALERRAGFLVPRGQEYLAREFFGDRPAPATVLSREVPTVFEIVSVSKAPDPATAEFSDCVTVASVRFVQGPLAVLERGRIALPAFRERRPSPGARFEVGDRVIARLLPWSVMPAWVRAVHRVDTTPAPDLPLFAVLEPRDLEAADEVAVEPLDGSGPTQGQSIAAELERVRARRDAHGGWAAWRRELEPCLRELAERTAGASSLAQDQRFVFRRVDFVAHGPPQDGVWPGPQIAMLTSFRDQLAARGIDLILVPFPSQEQITALRFLDERPDDGILDPSREELRMHVLEAGLEVVDLRPWLERAAERATHVYYDAEDGHPADGAIQAAARAVAERLRRYTFRPNYPRVQLRTVHYAIPRRYERFPPHAYEEGAYAATSVLDLEGRPLPTRDPDSPLLVVGDSFVQVPRNYGVPGADFLAQLAKETGVLARRFDVGDGGPQMLRHLAREGRELFEGCRVCVFVFRELNLFRHLLDDERYRWDIVRLPE